MARDYNKKRPPPKKSAPVPGWAWMLGGLAIGLFVAFLVYINEHGKDDVAAAEPQAKTAKAAERASAKKPVAKPEKQAAAKAEGAGKKPLSYDFYNILPEFEVEVPEESAAKHQPHPKTEEPPGNFVLQVGSFKNSADAESRKAELALIGVVASVQTVTVDGKATYHRVRVGPIREQGRLDRMRQTLRENGIEFVTVKERS